jgi:hypothetical protein
MPDSVHKSKALQKRKEPVGIISHEPSPCSQPLCCADSRSGRNIHRFLVVYKVISDFFLGSLGLIGEPKYFGLAIVVDSFGALVGPAGSRLSS